MLGIGDSVSEVSILLVELGPDSRLVSLPVVFLWSRGTLLCGLLFQSLPFTGHLLGLQVPMILHRQPSGDVLAYAVVSLNSCLQLYRRSSFSMFPIPLNTQVALGTLTDKIISI